MKVSRRSSSWQKYFRTPRNRRVASGLFLVVLIVGLQFWYEGGGSSDLTVMTMQEEAALHVTKSGTSAASVSPRSSQENPISTPTEDSSNVVTPPIVVATSTKIPTIQAPINHTKFQQEGRKRRKIYSAGRSDRSGATIQDMLMCHAYAFHQGAEYGGACVRDWTLPQFEGKKPIHTSLLEAIGLSKVLKFHCPKKDKPKLTNRQHYIQNDTAIFTKEYIEYLQELIEYPPKSANAGGKQQIAVHIRRGDITPCRPRTRGYPRYLPNQHFLRLIQRYNPSNESHVVIFSESQSFESFDEFHARGYEVVLDGSIGDVWRGILASDVVLLSRSSFSLVPALMTKGKVVFTPFWHSPLPGWEIVDDAFLNETQTEFRRLKATCPPKKKKK